MSIKPRNFQVLFLLLSLGSVIVSTLVFFVVAYQIGSDSIKREAMRTVGVAADGKVTGLLNRLEIQKHALNDLLKIEVSICGNGNPKQVESCLKRSTAQFFQVQKIQSLHLETSSPKMILQLGEPSGELVFDQSLKKGQWARFYNGGKANPYYLMQSETADKNSRIVVEYPADTFDPIFTKGTLGKNGESFLVDPKGLFVTAHKYHVESGTSHPIDAKPMVMCLGGQSGEIVGLDYAGMPIIHGFRYIPEVGGGCIMVHIDQREAFAELDTFAKKWAIAGLLLWAVLGVISYLISRELANQLKKNIDEAEEARRKLAESEKKYRQIFHSSKAVCLLIEQGTGKIYDVNDSACGYYGYTKDEMLSKNIYEINILPPSEINAAMEEAKAEKRNYLLFHHRLSSGEVRNVEATLSPLTIDGKAMIYSIVHDVTDRKKAEAALRVAETKYHTLFDESPDGVLLVDTKTAGLVEFNKTAHRQLGYTKDEFARLTISDFEVLESQEDTQKHIAKVIAEGSDIFETKHRTKDGKIRDVQVIAKAMVLEQKAYIHNIFRDITVQKENQRLIRESETRFRLLFENAPIGIVLFEAEGPCVMANESGAAIIGGAMEHMMRQNFKELDSWRRSGMLDTALRSLDTGKSERLEVLVVTSFGKKVHLDFLFTPITVNGRPHLMTMFNDISHLREAEIQMKAAKDEAEEANRLKDKFIMLVSHDLKTPLIGTLGLMQLLQKQPETSPENKRMFDLAVQSNKRMIRMIDQLLDINRIRSGKLQLNCHFCDGAAIVRQAVATVEDMAAQKGITLQNLVSEKALVIADPVFLEQVFCNLLTNAIKFSGKGKTVTIRPISGDNVVFAVEDSGVGIAPDIMKNIFSYHEKTSTRGTQGETGTGFGLPLSIDIMEALNGKLKVQSRPEGGTSFHVILQKPSPKLIIMEDSPGSCDALKGLLEERGFTVVASPHALKILEMLEEKRFDFLLVQLSAAKDTGAELLRLVGRDEKLRGMSLLAIGDGKCYRKNGGDEPDTVIDCGEDASKVIATIYSMLMDSVQERKD